jgi:hypothetical protein
VFDYRFHYIRGEKHSLVSYNELDKTGTVTKKVDPG